MSPFGEDVTWLVRTVTSQPGYGNDVVSFAGTDICNVAVIPGSSTRGVAFTKELVQAQDIASTDLTLILPARYAVSEFDRFTVRGLTFEVDGSPALSKNPFTARKSLMVRLKRVTG